MHFFRGVDAVTIELRHIRHVIAAAEHGSFRRAAIALRTQQSSISRSVGDIEYRLGATLFVRRPSGVKLTPDGKRFVDRASSAMAELGLAKSEIRPKQPEKASSIRIGVLTACPSPALAGLIEAYTSANASVRISLVEGEEADHVAAVVRHELEIAFVTGSHVMPDCAIEQVWTERAHVALPHGHVLADQDIVTWEELLSERFIVGTTARSRTIEEHLRVTFARLRRKPIIEQHSVGLLGQLAVVASGRGVAMVGEGIAGLGLSRILLRPIEGEALPVNAVWSATRRHPDVDRFLDLARSISEWGGPGLQPPLPGAIAARR